MARSCHWYKQYWDSNGLTTDGLKQCAQDTLNQWWGWYLENWWEGMRVMFDASGNLPIPLEGGGVFLKFNSTNLEWEEE